MRVWELKSILAKCDEDEEVFIKDKNGKCHWTDSGMDFCRGYITINLKDI